MEDKKFEKMRFKGKLKIDYLNLRCIFSFAGGKTSIFRFLFFFSNSVYSLKFNYSIL